MSYNYGFVGINNIQENTVPTVLLNNLVSFVDWGFLDKGGFTNLTRPASGMYGGEKTTLKLATDPNYTNGQVWQSFRQNWVWQSGVSTTTQPSQISGIYVNNTFRPYAYNPSSGFYCGSGYRIDYPNGRVIFDTPLPPTSIVSTNYSYKTVLVDKSHGYPFFREIQNGSMRLDQNFFTSSGDWAKLGDTRVQLPAVFIELADEEFRPLQLGGGQWLETDFVFYVLAENKSVCNNIADAIAFQKERTLKIYNSNTVSKSGIYALNHDGNLINKSYTYPYLIDNYNYGGCFIKDANVSKATQLSLSLFISTVRYSTEVQMTNLP